MRLLRLLALSFTLCVALPARSATDYTDIWWAIGGSESGWGVNLAQNANTIFATFFIYNTSGRPVWYTALLSRTSGETFVGNMVASSGGAWFGSPVWSPPTSNVVVGTVTLIGQTPDLATLSYTIDGVPVTKTIERTFLEAISVAGTYMGGVSAQAPGCSPSSYVEPVQLIVTQTGTPGTVRIDQYRTTDGSFICRMEGAGNQYGGVIDIPDAAYTCSFGLNARVHIFGLRPIMTGFEGRWFADIGSGCTETGNMSGVTQTP
jgi:hypothetical protein